MCTFSLLPTPDGLLVTSNRDEHVSRPDSTPPQSVPLGLKQVLYSADGLAQGTWFAVDSHGRYSVLLNGAFEKHNRSEHYRRSRGLILLELVADFEFSRAFHEIDLEHIEPFQIIHGNQGEAMQLVWDGSNKHMNPVPVHEPTLFCSATLYDSAQQSTLQNRFQSHLQYLDKPELDMQRLHSMPQNQGGLLLHRNQVRTTSISQALINADLIQYRFQNLLTGEEWKEQLHIQKSTHATPSPLT